MYSMTTPVEVWRAPMTETAYTTRRDWGQAVRVWSGRASVQPASTREEPSPARDLSQERLSVFLPFSAVVEHTDRLLIEGRWYEVDGEPERHSQTSRRHTRLTLWRCAS
ncbi:hypothetical protein SMD44_07375 [Streptomyces alboflavus]|uniref:Head-tail adaptor protein n=1 Tax=Streptomyces alboflavus TaxID=67267 RepID=A0A1Z1WNA6_9ACTN|nr:hypothetical protein SMD44_07375 [Streptomyces alboflavus]